LDYRDFALPCLPSALCGKDFVLFLIRANP
jgi:hypothetical protein